MTGGGFQYEHEWTYEYCLKMLIVLVISTYLKILPDN